MTIPILPNTSSKILLAFGILAIFISGSLMYDSFQKISESDLKTDSLLDEAEHLQSMINKNFSMSRSEIVKQIGEDNSFKDMSTKRTDAYKFADTFAGHNDTLLQQFNRLVRAAKRQERKVKLYSIPLDVSKWLIALGSFLTCVGYASVVFDERVEMKQKEPRRMY